MPLMITQSKSLRGMVIAAKFNASVPIGWPALQIIRRENRYSRTYQPNTHVALNITTEPRPTRYLNVYEYNLNSNFIVQEGDRLKISWHGDARYPEQIRFSLAYSNSRVPMVSFVGSNCTLETDPLILKFLHCEQVTMPNTGNITNTKKATTTPAISGPTSTNLNNLEAVTANERIISSTIVGIVTMTSISLSTTQALPSITQINKPESEPNITFSTTKVNEAIIISGVVIFSLFLLIILLLFVIICTFNMVRRRRKSASEFMNDIDSTETSRYAYQAQMSHSNTTITIILFTHVSV